MGEANVLKGISFSVESGKALGLLGRNGAGKTTTIRILMDENLSFGEKWKFIGKELRVGTYNGLLLGGMAFLFIGIYVTAAKGKTLAYAFTISGCVGISLLVAMMISSLVGVLTPMFFHKIKVDPAVASGPLITSWSS